jgi:hypothetical protein
MHSIEAQQIAAEWVQQITAEWALAKLLICWDIVGGVVYQWFANPVLL